jgi:nicotinate-nucleotide--dimethylbenzimidazole phosphoribosyltransferase
VADQIEEVCRAIAPPDPASARLSQVRQLTLARPAGSLGYLDDVVHRVAAIRGGQPDGPLPALVSVLAGDHGVAGHGTSAFRAGLTGTVLRLVMDGRAPVSILARQAGARVAAADFGLRDPVGDQRYKVAPGTGDISRADAMPAALARQAIRNGICYAGERIGDAQVIAVGELGVGNTTAAAALAARLTGLAAAAVVGAGSGVASAVLDRKRGLVEQALRRTGGELAEDPVALLAALGGYEIGGNVGVILAAALARRVVVLDGYITGVAALLAVRMCPAAGGYLIAAHQSAEPGHRPVLGALGLRPLLALDMRLGMASGAALAIGLINSVLAVAAQTPRARQVGLAEAR